jgi:hypothetical protein
MDLSIYVDAESFFDFRLAAILKYKASLKYKVAELYSEYQNRDHDDFSLLFHEISGKLDTTPTLELLKLAPITDVDDLIRQDILAYANRPDVDFKTSSVTVDFQGILLTEEQTSKLEVMISARFDHAVRIKIVSNKTLNLRKLDTRYQLAVIYDTNNRVVKEMTKPKHRLKSCNIQTPFRFLDGSVEAGRRFQEVAKHLPYKTTPDEIMKEQLLAVMPLHFVEMKFFCVKQL